MITMSGDSLRLRSPITVVLSLGGYPTISGCLLNSLISNHTANMQSGHNLRVSFSDAQTLRLTVSQLQKEKDSTANATLWRKPNLVYKELQQVKNLISLRGLVGYCSDDDLALCCRRLISLLAVVTIDCKSALIFVPTSSICLNAFRVSFKSDKSWFVSLSLYCRRSASFFIAVAINLPTLSPSFRVISSNSATSCGTRDANCTDLLLMLPVDMLNTPFELVYSSIHEKTVEVHITLMYGVCHLVDLVLTTLLGIDCKNSNAPKVLATTIEASNQQPLYGVTIMAIQQHNQTRLKFTFLIASGTQRLVDIHPVRLITVLADSEGEARLLAGIPSLIFVSRQEVNYAQP